MARVLEEPTGVGDHFQVVAFPDVSAGEASVLAQALIANLVARGVVLPEPSRDELAPGYPPGPNAHQHVQAAFNTTRELLHNGLEVETKRRVFHAGQSGIELACGSCGTEFEPGATFGDQVQKWFDGDDDVSLACPKCGHRDSLPSWDGPSPWAFGCLGLTFWNWPPLLTEFIRSLADAIGHRARVVQGKV